MATVNPTVGQNSDFTVITYTYSAMPNGDDGAPIPTATFADRTVQVSGTFGVGGSVTIEGSNDGVTYITLTESDDTDAIVTTAADIMTIVENPLYIRPRVTAGDGTTALDVIFACRRPTDKRQ